MIYLERISATEVVSCISPMHQLHLKICILRLLSALSFCSYSLSLFDAVHYFKGGLIWKIVAERPTKLLAIFSSKFVPPKSWYLVCAFVVAPKIHLKVAITCLPPKEIKEASSKLSLGPLDQKWYSTCHFSGHFGKY